MTPKKMVRAAAKAQGRLKDPLVDFRNFLHFLFIEGRGWEVIGELQYDIADYMQSMDGAKEVMTAEKLITRAGIIALRGAGKTEIAIGLALWLLYWLPDLKILVCSSTNEKAEAFTTLARQLIDSNQLLQHMRPQLARDGLVDKDQKDNLHGFVIGSVTKASKELSLASYGIFGTFTGCHPDVVISDDIETPENSLTAAKRGKLISKAFEYESLCNPGGFILHMGTPQSEESIYNKLADRLYVFRRWPCDAPNLSDQVACENVSPWILRSVKEGKFKPGDPTFPERWGRQALNEKLAVYGASMYNLQMLLNTKLADAERYPLKLRDLIVMDMHHEMAPESVVWGTGNPLDLEAQGLPGDGYYGPAYKAEHYANYQIGVMYVDPKGRGRDTVGVAVGKVLNGLFYLHDVIGLASGKGNDGTSESVMIQIAKTAAKYGIKKIGVEDNFGDGMYRKLLTPIVAKIVGPCEIVDIKSKGQKELRILDTLEPITQAHKLVITPKVAGNDKVMYQYTRITKDRGCLAHDDEIDAVSGAIGMVSDMLVVDPEKKEQQESAAERKRWLAAFRRNAIGSPLSPRGEVIASGEPGKRRWGQGFGSGAGAVRGTRRFNRGVRDRGA